MRILSIILFVFAGLSGAQAQPANIIADQTQVEAFTGGVTLRIGLSKAVSYRVFTLDDPKRLVVDLRDLDWANMPDGLMAPEISDIRFGLFQPGWSRLVVDLDTALLVDAVEMLTVRGVRVLSVRMVQGNDAAFADTAGAPDDGLWRANQVNPMAQGAQGLPLVALDAGHGGIDPGALVDEISEKALTLTYAQELRDALLATGRYRVLMIRDSDVFISLSERVRLARASGADVFISLHANTVTLGNARGTTVYNLSDIASNDEAAALAAFENRADLIAGVPLVGEDDQIAQVLIDMAQRETNVFSERFGDALADSLVDALEDGVRSRRMSAGFRVLRAPDIPSLLVELGFMSSERDMENMRSAAWRAQANAAFITALDLWFAQSAEMRGLLRK